MVITQIFLKKLSAHFSPNLVLGVRASLLVIANSIYLIWNNQPIHQPNKSSNTQPNSVFIALVKRSLYGSITLSLYLGSIKYLPVGIVNALFNTMPIMSFFI